MTDLRTEPVHDWESPPDHRAIGKLERLAYERHHRDLATGADRGIWFDDAAAEFAFDFFALLPLTKGRQWAGKPFELLPWEKFLVGSIFGWKTLAEVDGDQVVIRRFQTAYTQVAKKNGKTEIMSGVGTLGTVCDGEPGAEVYSVAMKRDQAKLVWETAGKMITRSPALAKRCEVNKSAISFAPLGAKFQPLSRDVNSQDGCNPSLLIIDEYHRFQNRDLVEMLVESMATRLEPLNIFITTAGAGSSTPCLEEREYAEKVLDGTIEDDKYFAYITEPDEDDDWDSEIAWEKANPSIDVLIRRQDLWDKCEKAKQVPSKQNDFRRYRCNQWTEQIERAIDMDVWKECGEEFDPDILLGRPCFGGLDVASKLDLAAFTLVFPPVDEDDDLWPNWYSLTWFWTPAAGLNDRSKKDRAQYPHWVEQGHLIADETGNGEIIRETSIIAKVKETTELYEILECGYDPWKAEDIAQDLQDHGLTMVTISQVVSNLTIGTKYLLEKLLPSRTLRHGGHPVLKWNASNFATWSNANKDIRPSRENSGGKIDGVVSLIIALCRAAIVKPKKKRSRYADRDWQATTLGKIG
jgi:phage terminase large subunit-like protein